MLVNEGGVQSSVGAVTQIAAAAKANQDGGKLALIDAAIAESSLHHQGDGAIQAQAQRQAASAQCITAPAGASRREPNADQELRAGSR